MTPSSKDLKTCRRCGDFLAELAEVRVSQCLACQNIPENTGQMRSGLVFGLKIGLFAFVMAVLEGDKKIAGVFLPSWLSGWLVLGFCVAIGGFCGWLKQRLSLR